MAVQRYCPHCGSTVASDVAQCPTCGAALPTPTLTAAYEHAAPPPQVVRSAGPTPPSTYSPPTGAAPQSNTVRAATPGYSGSPTPGYPMYPQGGQPQWGAYPYPSAAPHPYTYPSAYPPQYYPYPYTARPRRAPGETYPLVVAWIVTVLGAISILVGLLAVVIAVALSLVGYFSSLAFLNLVLTPAVAGIGGGVYAMVAGISRIRGKQSQRFTIPNPWLFVALTAVVMIVGVTLWNVQVDDGPGAALAVWPLNVLSAAVPGFGLLAFVAWRLRFPASRRHVWLSVIYGLTLGPLIAIILELIVSFAIDSSTLTNPNIDPNDPTRVIRLLIEISVAAPLVEELVKPLGAVLIMPRLKTASGAFLVGVAGGVGFAMFESVFTYIGTGEADWVIIALQRTATSVLHGLGAGMVALAWFYIFHGKGVSHRWWRVAGCAAYAVFQHGLNNAASLLLAFVPGPVGSWFNAPFYIGRLPMQYGIIPFYGLDVAMFVVLVVVTGRLARSDQHIDMTRLLGAPQTFAQPLPIARGGAAS